ncbi:flagellar motor switch protein FliM [Natranaerobius thermophilus]|uniref:Flagellar motor switch protein FliM n=1 Tax=Natranaerobius thermophilus (strain ATCC BAA-1301 / DSM 18059 / JW/NM-WN-LF) TaxID=457570 RepID=B2A358_NATTJ|nr:flagellar motor switch protein FliM [Natranaerobius thermophilus]ACB84988.1 flagellar motor switch protein FliM [Natranaerobius thermophilus JW/NM-WN-LF]
MSEVLSQSEIDDLLSAISTGDLNVEDAKQQDTQQKVKPYDFRRPAKFSKDQIRTLQMINENFARLLSTYLSAYLRSYVEIELASVDQVTYDEFMRSLTNPTIMGIFSAPPMEGKSLMEMNPNIAFAVIDRLMGGPGETFESTGELTEIEEAVARKIFNRMLDSMLEAWKNVGELEPEFERIENNPQFTQIISPNEIVAVVAFSVKVGEAEGLFNVCLPYIFLEPVIDRLSARFWFATGHQKKITEEESQALKNRLHKTQVPVKAELARTRISVKEFLNLQEGDVISLNKPFESEIDLIVGKKTKFKGKPGSIKNKLAVQITQIVREGDDSLGE